MDTTTWASKYDKAAMSFLADEHVICATCCTRTGGWKSMGVGAVSPLLASVMNHRDKKAAGKLPQMFLLAVTDTDVVALKLPSARSTRSVVILLAVFTTGLSTWVPWHSIAILLVMSSIAVVRLVGGPPR